MAQTSQRLGRSGSEKVIMGKQGASKMPGLLAWMEGEVGLVEGSTPRKQRPQGRQVCISAGERRAKRAELSRMLHHL